MIKTEEATSTFHGSGCQECGSPVAAARNPFYGIDLAVHKYVRNCTECSWYEFASDSGTGSRTDSDPTRGRALPGFWARVNAAVNLLKAA